MTTDLNMVGSAPYSVCLLVFFPAYMLYGAHCSKHGIDMLTRMQWRTARKHGPGQIRRCENPRFPHVSIGSQHHSTRTYTELGSPCILPSLGRSLRSVDLSGGHIPHLQLVCSLRSTQKACNTLQHWTRGQCLCRGARIRTCPAFWSFRLARMEVDLYSEIIRASLCLSSLTYRVNRLKGR
jgi:hypothetical protein